MSIRITRSKKKIKIEAVDADGNPTGPADSHRDYDTDASRKRAATACHVDKTEIEQALLKFHEAEQQQVAVPEPSPSQFVVTLRGLTQPAAAGRQFSDPDPLTALDAVLACADYPVPEPDISWRGLDDLALVDVDWHGRTPPDFHKRRQLIEWVEPKPARWWVSHGGGFKLVYQQHDYLTAAEQAEIAKYTLRAAGASGIEIASRTRHPSYSRPDPKGGGVEQRCSEVRREADGQFGRLKAHILGTIDAETEVDPGAVDAWLEENGMARGGRYTRDRCLINPLHSEKADTPVNVLSDGIYCHVCAGNGICYPDVSKPGFVPWRVLVEDEPAQLVNYLRTAVRGFVHWEHAKYIIGQEYEGTYRALLKLTHPDQEQRIGKVFYPATPLIRINGVWLDSKMFTVAGKDGLPNLLRSLPATQYTDHSGKLVTDPHTLGMFQGKFDLDQYGYAPVTLIRGVDLARKLRADEITTDAKGYPQRKPDRLYAVIHADPPFRYRKFNAADYDKAVATIRRCYPTVNLKALDLLIVAKAFVQRGGLIEIPKILIVGQTGGGKSNHARLAAQIAGGDSTAEMRFAKDVMRMLQGYADTSAECSYALFNEITKSGIKGNELRDMLLMLTKGIKYHELYIGPRRVDNPAVIVLTDPEIPPALLEDEQTARRIVLVDLGAGVNALGDVNWETTCETGTIEKWRAAYPFSDACDVYASRVIDLYLSEPGVAFGDTVKAIGWPMLDKYETGQYADMRELYQLVMAAPEHDGSSRWTGPSWRVFPLGTVLPVTELLCALAGSNLDNTQKIAGARWGRALDMPGMVCTIRRHRQQVGIRFQVNVPGQESAVA